MATLGSWKDLARKAAQALKRQLAQTESGLSALLNPGRAPQPIPVRLPPRGHSAPRFPGDRRYYTQWHLFGSGRAAAAASGKGSSSAVSRVGRLVTHSRVLGQPLTRPRLSSGTLRSHGYGRNFSTTGAIDHAQVAREVFGSISLGIRAGVLNTPFFPPPTTTTRSIKGGSPVLCEVQSRSIDTRLIFQLLPAVLLPTTGTLSPSLLARVDETLLSAPRFLARLRRDLNRLSAAGAFEYQLLDGATAALAITFPGKSRDEVEKFLADIGVVSGVLREDEQHARFAAHEGAREVDWHRVFTQDSKSGGCSIGSLDRYVEAADRLRFGADTIRAA